jgi:hypothetical protein
MRSLFEQAKAIYAPEGKYMTGIEATVQRGEKKAVAGGMQGLAAAGLAGTSMMGGLSKKYQEEVAQPTLARATTERLSALANIMSQEAGSEGSMAARTTTTVGPMQRTMQRPTAPTAARPASRTGSSSAAIRPAAAAPTKKATPLISMNMGSYSRKSPGTGQVYFGAATYAKPVYSGDFMGPPPGGDVQRSSSPDIVKDAYSSFGQNIAMFKDYS